MKGVYNGPGGFARLTRIFGTNKLSRRIDAEILMQSAEFFWDDDAAPVVLTNFPYSADMLSDDHPDVIRVKAINKFLKNQAWQQKDLFGSSTKTIRCTAGGFTPAFRTFAARQDMK